MLEQRRLDYLQAMGITQWMPREPLPHAPQPRWLPKLTANHHSHQEVEQLAQSHHIPPVMAAELLVVGDAAEKIAEKLANSTDTERSQHSTTVAEVTTIRDSVTAVDVADLTPPRFDLYFLLVGQCGLWVCSDEKEVDAMMRFAHRVMLGMQQPIEVMQAPLRFHWPFIESSHQDQSAVVAAQALAAQWQHFQVQGVSYVMAFGDAACQWLPNCVAELAFQANDLESVLHSAQEKRRLWQALLQQQRGDQL